MKRSTLNVLSKRIRLSLLAIFSAWIVLLGTTWAQVAEQIPPVNIAAPTISGVAEDGATLTADPGTWTGTDPIAYAYQWRRCDSLAENCGDLPAATGQTYTITSGDVGSTLIVQVTATNEAGSAAATSDPTAIVQALAPSSTSAPTISGTAKDGETLTADPGSWTGTPPITYAYQWRRCTTTGAPCVNIAEATGSTYTLTSTDVGATIRVAVEASNQAGSATAVSVATRPVAALASPSTDPAVAAAGDIACDPASPYFNDGVGTKAHCHQKYTSDLLVGMSGLAAVLGLGDEQYNCGGYNAFLRSYDLSWGRVKGATYPALGDEEYKTSGGTDCDATGKASGYFSYFGAAAGPSGKGYYSFDVGAWHVVVLNSNCSKVGGCGAGSVQEKWLKADLASHPSACTLAYWHNPRFSSSGNSATGTAFWQDLFAAGADIVLGGHRHYYERFAPQNPSGGYDPVNGIRQFVVGTGGKGLQPLPSTTATNSERRHAGTFGVLRLTLHQSGYDWKFMPEAGKTFTDSGSGSCH